MKNILTCLLLYSLAFGASAQPIPSGLYMLRNGGGQLEIKVGSKFQLNTVGANAHVCDVEGVLANGISKTDQGCLIDFSLKNGRLTVAPRQSTVEQCRSHCGARANFAGDYMIPPALCSQARRTEREFAKSYANKDYGTAKKTIAQYLLSCSEWMQWTDLAGKQNDLAITEFHLNNPQGCLAALEPLRVRYIDITLDADAFGGEPAYQELAISIAKKSQFNWKKCGGKINPPAK
jgi:hypothetical protein